jgi:hypothetical protein
MSGISNGSSPGTGSVVNTMAIPLYSEVGLADELGKWEDVILLGLVGIVILVILVAVVG